MESIRRYSELVLLPTFIERYRYLRLGGGVGQETFGLTGISTRCFTVLRSGGIYGTL